MSEGFTEKVQSGSVSALDKCTLVLQNSSVSDVPQPSSIHDQGGGENNWNLDTEPIEDKNPFSGFSEEHLNKLDEVLSSAEVRQILQQSVTEFGINMDLNNSIPSTSHDDDGSQESSDGDAKPMELDQVAVPSTFIDHAYCMPADRMPKIKTSVSPVLSLTKMPIVETGSSPEVSAVLSPVVALMPLIPGILPKPLEKSDKNSDDEMEGAAEPSTTSPRKSSRKRENKKYSEEEWETSPSPRGRGRGRGRGKSMFDDNVGNKRQSTRISDMRQREMAEKILKENRQALEAEKAQLAQEDTQGSRTGTLDTKTDTPRGRPRKTVKDGEVEKEQLVQEEGSTESPRRTRQAAKEKEVEKEQLAQKETEAKEGEPEKEQHSQEETKAESPQGRMQKAAKDNNVEKDEDKEQEKETMENDEEEKETSNKGGKTTEKGKAGKKVKGNNAVGKKEKAMKVDAVDENEDKNEEGDENIDVGEDDKEIKDDKNKKKVKKKVVKKGPVTCENDEKKEKENEVGNTIKVKGKKGKLKMQGKKKVKRVGKFKKEEGEQDKESEEEQNESVPKKKVTKKLLKKKAIVKVSKLIKKKTLVKIKKGKLKKKAEEKKNKNEEESKADESSPKKKKMKKLTTGDSSKNEGKLPGKKKKGKVDSEESSSKKGADEEEGGKVKVKRKRGDGNAEVDEQCSEKGEKQSIKKDFSKKNGQSDMGMKTDEEDEIPLKKLKKNADQAKPKEEIKKKKKREQTEKNNDVPLKKLKTDTQKKESGKEGLDRSTTKTDSEQESVNMKKDKSKEIDSRRKSVIVKDLVEKGDGKVEKRRDSKDSKSSYDSKDGKHHHHHHHTHGHSHSIERRDSKDHAKLHKDEKHGQRHESVESKDSSVSGDKKCESKEKVTPIKSIDYKDFVKSLKAEKKKRKSEDIIFDPTVTDLFKPDVIKSKEEPAKEADKLLDKNKKDLLDSKEVNKDCIGSVIEQTVKVELPESPSHKSNSDLAKELDFQEFVKSEDSDMKKDETASVEIKAQNVSVSNIGSEANVYNEDIKDNSVFTDSLKNEENVKEELEETKLVPKVINIAVPKGLENSLQEKDGSKEQEVNTTLVVSVSMEEELEKSKGKEQSEQAPKDTEKEKHREDVEKRGISKDLEGNKDGEANPKEDSSKPLLKKEVDMTTNKELQRKDSGRALRESSRKSLALIESLKEKPGKECEEEEIDDTAFEDDENDETWEDPSKLYCICRQPHDKRFMICCDKCEEWYHGKCVGISAATGKEMELNNEEYICLKCSGKEDLNKKSLQTGNQRTDSRDNNKGKSEPTPLLERLQAEEAFKIESKKVEETKKSSGQESVKSNVSKKRRDNLGQIQKRSPEKSDDKKKRFKHFRESSEKSIKEKSSSYQQCMGEDCKNEARKDSIYCSNECIVKHAQNALKVLQKSQETGSAKTPIKDAGGSERVAVVDRKTGQVLSGSKAPSKAELEKWLENHPTYEVFAPSSKVTSSKKTEDKGSSQKEKKEKEKDKHLAEKVKDRPKDSRNSTDSKTPAKTTEGPDPVRLNVRKSLRDALAGRSEGADDVMLSSSEIKGIALAIEEELFKYFRDTGHKYKAKYRSLIFNIKDPKNFGLFRKILSRRLKPYKLVRMSPEELASQELAKWRAQEAKHTLQMIEKTETEHSKESTHVVKKTHKGEVEVEEEQDLSSLVEAKKEPLKIDPKADLLSELIPDSTDQHRQHLFDLNCKICTGKMANPDESTPSKIVQKTEVTIKSPEMEKKEEEAKEKPMPPEDVVREVMKAIQRAKREADSSTARQVTVRSPDSALQSGLEKKATFTPSGPMLWKGFVFMQEVSKFVTTAYRITGPTDHLDLPDTIHVCGRINPEQVWDYLSKIKQTGSKNICAIRFIPGSQEEKTAYIHLYSYLNSRSRCGVVGNASKLIKDFYIVPLASHSKIPSVLKPFEGPGFEENRPHMLIGVIVRQKPKQPGAVSKEPVEVKQQHQAPQDPRKQKVTEKVVKKVPASYTPTSTTQPPKIRGPGTPTSGKRSASSTPQTSSSTPASTPKSVSSSSEKGVKPSRSITQDRIIKEYSNVEEAEEDSPYEPPDSGPNEDDEAYDPEREEEKNKSKTTTSMPKPKQGTGVIGGETMSKIIQKIAMSKNPAEATAAMVAALASTKGLGNQRRLLMELTQKIDQQKKLLEAKRREVQGGDLAGVATGMETLAVSTDISSQSMTVGSPVVSIPVTSTAVESIAVSSVVTTAAAVGTALASTVFSKPDVVLSVQPSHSGTTSNVDVKISVPTAVSDSKFTSSLSSVGLSSVQEQPGTLDVKQNFESSAVAESAVSSGLQNDVTKAGSAGLIINEKDKEKQLNSRKQVESNSKVPESGDNAVSSSVSVKDEASKIKEEEEPESETPSELPTALQSLFSFIPSGSVSGLKIIKTKIPVTYSSGPKKSEKDAPIVSQTKTSVNVVSSETLLKPNGQEQNSVVSIVKSDVSATSSTEKLVQDQKVSGTTKVESTGPEKKSKTKTFLGFEYDSDSSEGSFEGFDVDDVRKESPRKKSSRASSKQIDTVVIPGLGSLDQCFMEDKPSEHKEPDSTDPDAVTDFGDTDIRIGQQRWQQPLGNIEPDLDLPSEDQDLRKGFDKDMRFDQDMRQPMVDVDERIQGPLYLQPLPPGVHPGPPGGLPIRPPMPGEPQDIDQRIAPFPFPGPPGIRPRLPFMALNQPPPPGEDWQPGQPAPPPLPPRPLIRPPPPPLPPHPPEPTEKEQPSEIAEDSDMRSTSASEKSGDPDKEEKEKQKGKAKIKDKDKKKDSSELTSDERLKQIVLQIASQPQPPPMKPPPVPPVAMSPVGSLSSQGIMPPHQGPVLSEGMMPLHSSMQPISQGIPGMNLGPGPMQPGLDHHWQGPYTEANMPPISEIHSSGVPPMSRESYQPSSSGINSTAVMQHQPSIPSLLDLPSQSVGSTQLPSRPHIERDRFRHRSRSPHVSQEDIDYSEDYNKPRNGYPRASMSRPERGNRSDFRGHGRGRIRGHDRDWHGGSGGRDRDQRQGGHRLEGRSRHSSMDYSEY